MTVALSFAPWIVFTAVGGADWRLAAVAAIVTLGVVTAVVPPRRFDLLTAGMVLFFSLAGFVAMIDAGNAVFRWLHPLSAAWMCTLLLVSVVVGRPGTPSIARTVLHPDVVTSTAFAAISRRVSMRWAGAFSVVAIAAMFAAIVDRPVIGTLATVFAIGWALRSTAGAAHTANASVSER